MPEPELARDATVVRRDDAISERLLQEAVVLNLDSDAYARLNATGRWLWEKLEAPQTVDSLARALAAEYEIDEQRALADVREFLRGLLERGLVQVNPR